MASAADATPTPGQIDELTMDSLFPPCMYERIPGFGNLANAIDKLPSHKPFLLGSLGTCTLVACTVGLVLRDESSRQDMAKALAFLAAASVGCGAETIFIVPRNKPLHAGLRNILGLQQVSSARRVLAAWVVPWFLFAGLLGAFWWGWLAPVTYIFSVGFLVGVMFVWCALDEALDGWVLVNVLFRGLIGAVLINSPLA
ncbi:hypothetical protein JCM10207_005035 [Rhodosporidiobolus poonsookiae]